MAHIPLGYKIVDGCAVVDEPTVGQIKATYRYYFEGKSLYTYICAYFSW